MQYSPNKDRQHLKWQQLRSWISSPDCLVAMDKQQTQYQLIPKWKMEDAHKLLKIPKLECPDIWIRLPRHKMAKIMVQYGRSSCSSWLESVRSSFGRTIMGKAIWENPIEAWLGESSKLGVSLCASWKRIILICVCGWQKFAGKKQNLDSMWKVLDKEVDLGDPTSFFDHEHLCFTQRHCQIRKDIVDNYRTMFESRISVVRSRQITIPSKSSYFFMVLWHGWSCKEVCGTILWVGKQDDSATLQSIYSMHRWPPLQGRRNEIFWRIVKYMLSNCSEMLILSKNWTTWYSMVSKKARTIHHKMDQMHVINSWIDWFHNSSYMWIQTFLSCG